MQIVNRAAWGARHGRGQALTGMVGHVVIHHTAGPVTYHDATAEAREVASIERYHQVVNGWDGIGYSWLVAPSGRVYEGRGWGRVGAHTQGHNSSAYGICLMGNGEVEPAPPMAWAAVRGLIEHGIHAGRITPSPQVTGHLDHAGTACPGTLNYARLDLLRDITGSGAELEENDMPLSTQDFDRLEGMIRRVLGEAVGPGQRTWPGTVAATLDGVQRIHNITSANGAQLGAVDERLARVEEEIAAMRRTLGGPPVDDPGATVVLPPRG